MELKTTPLEACFEALASLEAAGALAPGLDERAGRHFVFSARWRGQQPIAARRILDAYPGALAALGLDPRPPEPGPGEPMERRATLEDGRDVVLAFPYNAEVVADIGRLIPARGATYRPASKTWRLRATRRNLAAIVELLCRHDFDFPPGLVELGRAQLQAAGALADGSRAVEPALPAQGPRLRLGMSLYPYQRAGVDYAVRARRCIIADEMGLGKTAQALAALEALRAFPAVIVCPACVKLKWGREARRWLPGRSVAVLETEGREPMDAATGRPASAADVWVINYDLIAKCDRGRGSAKEFPVVSAIRDRLGPVAAVLDESHYVKNNKALRSIASDRLLRGMETRIFLSGTPVLSRPFELANQLRLLGQLEEMGGFWRFVRQFCDAKKGPFGWDFTGASRPEQLNAELRALCFIRRTKAEVLPDLPEKTRSRVPVEMEKPKAYAKLEAELADWLDAQPGVSGEHLVRINALRREAGEQKVAAVRRWIADFLESSGEKLVVFGHHKDILEAIARPFGAPKIDGAASLKRRQEITDAFQNDAETRLVVCNIQAGGVGIDLTAAANVAFVEFPWTAGELVQAEDRCHRIGQGQPVTAWHLYAPGTIDEDMLEILDSRLAVSSGVLDGDAMTLPEVAKRLAARKGKRLK